MTYGMLYRADGINGQPARRVVAHRDAGLGSLPDWTDSPGIWDACWERAAELTACLGGRWEIRPGLLGWSARPVPRCPGQRRIWSLTLMRLRQRIEADCTLAGGPPGSAPGKAKRQP
jgi:hypothetical protein